MLKMNILPRKNPQTGEFLYYGQLSPVTPTSLNALADAISAECTVTIHDIKAVISALEEQIYRTLRDGGSIRLGDLGSFHPTISTFGVVDPDKLGKQHVKAVRCRFCPSSKLRFELSTKNPNMKIMVASRPESANGGNNG